MMLAAKVPRCNWPDCKSLLQWCLGNGSSGVDSNRYPTGERAGCYALAIELAAA